MLQPSWTWNQPLHSGLGDSAWCRPPCLPSVGQCMLLSSVRESSRCFRVCRSTLLPAIICGVSPHSLLLWFYPACCGRLSRCVTPTWADPARTSSSSGRWGGACRQHQRFSPSSWEIPGAASRCVTSAELRGAQPYPTP